MKIIKRISNILILFFFLQNCDYKPIYSNSNDHKIKLNVINIIGDNEMNNFVIANIKKYSDLSSEKTFYLDIVTKYTREGLIKNKKGETKTFLLNNSITFQVTNNDVKKKYSYNEKIKITNSNDEFATRKYEETIKKNFISSKVDELILNLSGL